MKKVFVGIDISKSKLDLCVLKDNEILKEKELVNSVPEIKKFFIKIIEDYCVSEILICAEYTGIYTYHLGCVCTAMGLDLWLENPYQVRLSSGVHRSKNDRLDAKRIAYYCYRYQDKMQLFSKPDIIIASLQLLLKERDIFIVHRSTYKQQLTDQKGFVNENDYDKKKVRLDNIIKELDNTITGIESEIKTLIKSNDILSQQYKLLLSVDGVGNNIATKMIVETNGFKNFVDGNSFCCHAGLAPFEYTSGSSIRSKRKVSHKADKEIKKLLHMGALSSTKMKNSDLSEYYNRKVSEGKNKMSILNAIRSKMVLRMFAVIRDNKPYTKNT